jgi:hypothetical protein
MIKFVVIKECMLGYVDPRTPLSAGILGVSVLKGAGSSKISAQFNGSYPLPYDPNKVRPATQQDFETFRVCPEGYKNDPNYDFPRQ